MPRYLLNHLFYDSLPRYLYEYTWEEKHIYDNITSLVSQKLIQKGMRFHLLGFREIQFDEKIKCQRSDKGKQLKSFSL
jgi:hypothetical protein